MSASETKAPSSIDWAALVQEVQSGDDAGMEQMYAVFSKGVRFFLQRQMGNEHVEDKLHDAFLIVIKAIRNGEIREPDRLMGFVRTIVRRQVASYIDKAVQARRDEVDLEAGIPIADRADDPEKVALRRERIALMKDALATLSERDRDILVRYYLKEESVTQICRDMSLTETQFRLFKSRAKAKFGEIGQRKLRRRIKVGPITFR